MTSPILPPMELVKPETPLRLAAAAAIAFPDGSMSAAILKSEADKGRLAIRRIGGRYYTTLHDIDDMLEKCRVEPKAQGCGCAPPAGTPEDELPTRPSGSSGTDHFKKAQAAALLTLLGPNGDSHRISQKSTSSPAKADVLPMKSRSRIS